MDSNNTKLSSIIENAMPIPADIQHFDIVTNMEPQESLANFHQSSNQESDCDYSDESVRYNSFTSWINKDVSKQKLARYGLYFYFERDNVRCHFCEVVIGEWGVGDDPLTEHRRHSPDCDLINMRPTNNKPIGDETILFDELKTIVIEEIELNPDMKVKYPEYKDAETRLKSYANWPKHLRPTPKDLSDAGFFYLDVGDKVKCFFCGGSLKDWEKTDIALQEHIKHFYEQCHFIKIKYKMLSRKYSKNCSKSMVKADIAQLSELKKNNNKMWEELANHLNNIDGPRKNIKAWKEVWRNHKYNSQRSATSRQKMKRTNQAVKQKKLNQATVESDTTNSGLDSNYNNTEVSMSTDTKTEYQSKPPYSVYNDGQPEPNKNYELGLCKPSIIENAMADIQHDDIVTNMEPQECFNYDQSSNQPGLTDFNHESVRLHLFESRINNDISKQNLAQQHHRHSPDCDFINIKSTNNIPIGDETTLFKELKTIVPEENKIQGTYKVNLNMIPKHPEYKDAETRLKSYANWPKDMQPTPKDLSDAGFFYSGDGDGVNCFFCGGWLGDWEVTDNPLQEHKNHFYEQCQFIKINYKELKRKYSKKCSKNKVKATPAQISELTKYMNNHPDLKHGTINLSSNKTLYNRMWEELANHLNNIDGPRKNIRAWKDVWRNHKCNSKRSATSRQKVKRTNQAIEQTNVNQASDESDNSRLHFNYNNTEVSTSAGTTPEYQSNSSY